MPALMVCTYPRLGAGSLRTNLASGNFEGSSRQSVFSALGSDHLLEFLEGGPFFEGALDRLLGRKRGTGHTGEANNLHAELEHEFLQVFRALPFEELDRFLDLKGGADCVAEGLVHIRDQGHAATASWNDRHG